MRILLKFVLLLAYEMAEKFDVVVDAKPEAADFYKRYGFMQLDVVDGNLNELAESVSMFLPLKAIPKPDN